MFVNILGVLNSLNGIIVVVAVVDGCRMREAFECALNNEMSSKLLPTKKEGTLSIYLYITNDICQGHHAALADMTLCLLALKVSQLRVSHQAGITTVPVSAGNDCVDVGSNLNQVISLPKK